MLYLTPAALQTPEAVPVIVPGVEGTEALVIVIDLHDVVPQVPPIDLT
jgi:hypothetical protein